MKEIFKKLPPKQIWQIIKSHIFASILIFALAMFAAGAIYGKGSVSLIIFSIISLFIYFIMIYGEAYNIAKSDKKSYTPQQPYILKGFLLPVGLGVLTVVLYLLHYYVWKYMSVNDSLTSITAAILNMPYIIWTYAFNGIIGLEKGIMSWYGYIIVIFVPMLFSGIGYIAGITNFDLTEKLSKYIYEKKD